MSRLGEQTQKEQKPRHWAAAFITPLAQIEIQMRAEEFMMWWRCHFKRMCEDAWVLHIASQINSRCEKSKLKQI
jgi:hypothetical protein